MRELEEIAERKRERYAIGRVELEKLTRRMRSYIKQYIYIYTLLRIVGEAKRLPPTE